MPRATGARSQLAAAFESTYGTAPASGFLQMPFVRSTLGSEQPLEDSELLGYGRDPLDADQGPISAGGDIVVPIDAESFGIWLKGAFGTPTTTEVTGVYTHVFESGSWNLPSLSIERAFPEVPYYPMNSGCKVDRLSWTMQRSGKLQATVGLIAQGESTATSTQAGTPTEYSIDSRFNHFQGAIMLDGSAMGNVISNELTYSNNLDRVETIRADGKIDGADEGMGMLSGRTVVRFAETTLLTKASAGTPVALVFSHTIDADASLTITVPRVLLPKPKVQIEGPAGVQVTYEWQAAQQSNGDAMVTATLVNEVASY